MKLFRVSFKVRPAKDHPRFWDIQFGFVQVWIYGESPTDAGERAFTIVEQLPYELFDAENPSADDAMHDHEQLPYELFDAENTWQKSVKAGVFSTDHEPVTEGFKEAIELASGSGVFVGFYGCETGTSEAGFENMNLM